LTLLSIFTSTSVLPSKKIMGCGIIPTATEENINAPIILWLNAAGIYELIHACFGHPGQKVMAELHHHVDGLHKL
jgi:hypothetical protein